MTAEGQNMKHTMRNTTWALLLMACGGFSSLADTAATLPAASAPILLNAHADAIAVKALLAKEEASAIQYLLSVQDKTGAWSPETGPAVTALVVRGLVQSGRPLSDPAVAKGLAFIETFHQPDGGYYKDAWPNYCTCIVLGLMSQLPPDAYREKIAKAQEFLRSIQSVEGKVDDQGKPITPAHPWYGGAGYAGKGATRPDLSNTAFYIEALRDSGAKADDPAIKNALIFVSRCQMNSETNDLSFAKGQSSGGFIYSTNAGGESKFPNQKDREGHEILAAYGSMTYAGLKSFIYAGLTKDDPRVQQAWKWIKDTWTLNKNPGSPDSQGEMGLYYYLHTFAKTLHITDETIVVDAKGVPHNWRLELANKLAAAQKPDGKFVNNTETQAGQRWMEANPTLVTAYMVLALQEAQK